MTLTLNSIQVICLCFVEENTDYLVWIYLHQVNKSWLQYVEPLSDFYYLFNWDTIMRGSKCFIAIILWTPFHWDLIKNPWGIQYFTARKLWTISLGVNIQYFAAKYTIMMMKYFEPNHWTWVSNKPFWAKLLTWSTVTTLASWSHNHWGSRKYLSLRVRSS